MIISNLRPGIDVLDAMKYYRRQSTVRPLRDDGFPNRPLTAFTITFERVE